MGFLPRHIGVPDLSILSGNGLCLLLPAEHVRIVLWKIVERSVFPPHRFFHAQEFRAKLPVSDGCVDGQDRNCDGDRSEGTDHHNEWDRHHGSVGPATSEESLDSDGATGKQHRIGGGEIVDLTTEEQ